MRCVWRQDIVLFSRAPVGNEVGNVLCAEPTMMPIPPLPWPRSPHSDDEGRLNMGLCIVIGPTVKLSIDNRHATSRRRRRGPSRYEDEKARMRVSWKPLLDLSTGRRSHFPGSPLRTSV